MKTKTLNKIWATEEKLEKLRQMIQEEFKKPSSKERYYALLDDEYKTDRKRAHLYARYARENMIPGMTVAELTQALMGQTKSAEAQGN